MSKRTAQNSQASEIEILRESSKSMISNLRQLAPNGKYTKKSCYSISCTYDDKSILEKKITVRDPHLENFDTHFDNAVKMNSDYVVVTVYEGEGVSATELQGSQNVIRIKEKSPQKPKSRSNLSGPPEIRPETNNDLAVLRLELMNENALIRKESEHQQQLWEKNKLIDRLETEKSDLEKENKELVAAYGELVKDNENKGKDDDLKLRSIGQLGLGAITAIIAANPTGKLLGVIPNAMAAQALGIIPQGEQLEQGKDAATVSKRKVYYDVFEDFFETLTDEEFEKLHAIISEISNNKKLLDSIVSAIQVKSKSSQ